MLAVKYEELLDLPLVEAQQRMRLQPAPAIGGVVVQEDCSPSLARGGAAPKAPSPNAVTGATSGAEVPQ